MGHDLGVSLYAHPAGAKFVLDPPIDAFDRAAFVVTSVLGKGVICCLAAFGFPLQHFPVGLAARIRVDNRHMSQRKTVGLDLRSIVGGVHHVLETGDPSMGDFRQGNGHLTVMQGGGGEYAADGNAAIGGIDMKFVPGPTRLIALAVFFGADMTGRGQLGNHFAKRLACDLVLPSGRFFGAFFSLFRAAPIFRLLFLRCCFLFRFLPCLDRRGILGDVTDYLFSEVLLNQSSWPLDSSIRRTHLVGGSLMPANDSRDVGRRGSETRRSFLQRCGLTAILRRVLPAPNLDGVGCG